MSQSSPSNNVVQLQSALKSLEDRYMKLQRRADSVNQENERLVTSRSELMAEVERLQDQQIRLRERNLRLTQEFHSKQQECSLLAEKLTMFARGRVGNLNKSENEYFKLKEVREDVEGSFESLETIELQGPPVARPKILNVSKRTLSEPNLSVIQHELEKVRKGLWSPGVEAGKEVTVEEMSSQIISNLKKSQSDLDEQFSKMVEIQQKSMETVCKLSDIPGIIEENNFIDEADPLYNVQKSIQTAMALQEKLQNQNFALKKLHNVLTTQPDTSSSNVVTQTSFISNIPDSITSSVWKNMQTDRICPLCETVFSTVISQEEFEDHVMDHFTGDDVLLPDFEVLEA